MQIFGIGFLVLLFLEIMSIVWVADWLGGGWTLFLMIASFAAGVMMLRRTGMAGVLLAGAAVRGGGKVSLYQMLWPIRYTVAALLLLSPGFVSMLGAFILLLPIRGKPIEMKGGFQQTYRQPDAGQGDVIDGDYVVTRDETRRNAKQDYIEHKPD